jgi:glucokinase
VVARLKLRPVVSSPGRAQRQRERKQRDVAEVLRQFREHDSASGGIAERHWGLSSSRRSAAVSFLLEKGLLERSSNGRSKAGPRNGAFGIHAGYGHVVGVDIGASNLRIALADMNGAVLGKWSASTRKTSSPDMVIEQIRKGVQYLLQHAALPRRSLLAIAAGAPGITNGDAGVVTATSYLRGWKDVRLRSLLESALRIPATVENDVRMAAIGENWRGAARGIGNFVFLALGTGIAAGVFANGRLIYGADWTAGEIGYMHVPGGPEEATKPRDPGSLESVIGGEGIQQQWLHGCSGTGVRVTGDLSATEIFDRARAGDELAERILNRSAKMLAYAVYNISLVLNCSLFVLGGGVGMSEPLLDSTRRFLEAYSEPVRPKLTVSSLGPDAQLMGAIRLALDKADSRIGLPAGD